MGIYEELGVPPVINAMGTFTIYGGSKMSPQTLRDMQEAAASFVDIRHLQRRLSQAAAELTHNEAAYICGGASCGVYLSLLAAIAKKRGKKVRHLTREDFYRSEVILFRSHRNPYDIVLDQLGVKLVELAYQSQGPPGGYPGRGHAGHGRGLLSGIRLGGPRRSGAVRRDPGGPHS